MYVLQENLFSFEELQKLESKERLPIFFGALDLRPYAKELRSRSPRGADVQLGQSGDEKWTSKQYHDAMQDLINRERKNLRTGKIRLHCKG